MKIEASQIRKGTLFFRAINHKLRRDILDFLLEKGEMTVTDIYLKLKLEQSVASQHLAILRRHKFVNTNRQGKFIYYSTNTETINKAKNLLEQI